MTIVDEDDLDKLIRLTREAEYLNQGTTAYEINLCRQAEERLQEFKSQLVESLESMWEEVL